MKKFIPLFILILSLSMVNGYAISLCNAKDIEYEASDTTWDVDTVSDALNDLYQDPSDIINYPNLWEPNKEYNFGHGLYGIRITGTVTIEKEKSHNISFSNIQNLTGIVEQGGWWVIADNSHNKVPVTGHQAAGSAWFWIENFDNDRLNFVSLSYQGNRTNASYDAWVKYTK